ncbi:MAG TPA: MBL fold metallo-hydrolase [Pyrinomonadaceae bacterium]|nr:MBL fold metallo-hydrolase [Pyrinomonadaceae bacterium]
MQTLLAILVLLGPGLPVFLAKPQLRIPASATPIVAATRTEVILLGTGTPYPDPSASGPATAVVVDGRVLLFDSGPGVMRRLKAAGLPISGPEALFITHLHSDHTLGYPDLILTSWVMRRRAPFPVYGPRGLRRMTKHLMAAYSEDIHIRETGLEHEAGGGYRVDVHEISGGVVYEKDGVRVTAIAVLHGEWQNAFAYRIDTPDRSIVISGDTRPSEELVKAAQGVDILIHEVYSAARLKPEDRPGGQDWPRYCREYHTSDVELGTLAKRIRPGLLILDHIIRMGASDEELLSGVRAGGYAGKVIVGKDLERF